MKLTRELWQSIRQIEDPTRRKLGETAYEMLFRPRLTLFASPDRPHHISAPNTIAGRLFIICNRIGMVAFRLKAVTIPYIRPVTK